MGDEQKQCFSLGGCFWSGAAVKSLDEFSTASMWLVGVSLAGLHQRCSQEPRFCIAPEINESCYKLKVCPTITSVPHLWVKEVQEPCHTW